MIKFGSFSRLPFAFPWRFDSLIIPWCTSTLNSLLLNAEDTHSFTYFECVFTNLIFTACSNFVLFSIAILNSHMSPTLKRYSFWPWPFDVDDLVNASIDRCRNLIVFGLFLMFFLVFIFIAACRFISWLQNCKLTVASTRIRYHHAIASEIRISFWG